MFIKSHAIQFHVPSSRKLYGVKKVKVGFPSFFNFVELNLI